MDIDPDINTLLKILEYEEKENLKYIEKEKENKIKKIVLYKPLYDKNLINYIFICYNIYNLLLYINYIYKLIENKIINC